MNSDPHIKHILYLLLRLDLHKKIILLISLLSPGILCAQKQNNQWNFGNRASLDFNSGSPVSFTGSSLISIENCATVSDPNTGGILFYTNGVDVWNKNNMVMPNGSGLLGGQATSSTQGVLIVAYPEAPNKYLVFTADETNNGALNGFRYSVVNMSLDNNNGDIEPGQKNILIQNNTTERLAVAKKSDGKGFWVLIHERDNAVFKAFEVTKHGVSLNPVISNTGWVHSTIPQVNGDETMGCMQFNHAFNKLAVAIYAANKVQVFDFDNCSGILSNPLTIPTLDNPYGVAFSPNNTRLYFSLYYNAGFNGVVYQADMLALNIPSSATLVGISSSLNFQSVGALQLAPDGKIYLAVNSESWLSAIEFPDTLGVACNFIDKAVMLQPSGVFPSTAILGLPQTVLLPETHMIMTNEIAVSDSCKDSVIEFNLIGDLQFNAVLWDFGDSASSSNTANTPNAFHVYKNAGSYLVTLVLFKDCGNDTLTRRFDVLPCDIQSTGCNLFVPNAFSPNSDGLNDSFLPVTDCEFESYRLSIYNRWGELLFDTSNLTQSWNGSYKNSRCETGTYFYYITFKRKNASAGFRKGDIMLIR